MLLVISLGVAIIGTSPTADFAQVTREWRLKQEASLKQDRGWLAVAGLFWLEEGENSFGTDVAPKIRIPGGPPVAGAFTRRGKEVYLESPAEGVTVNGASPTAVALKSDASGRPDSIRVGRVEINVIQRGDRIGIRLYDPLAETRTKFKGRTWFPADEKWVIRAKFVPYNPPKKVSILNVLGDRSVVPVPGYVEFKRDGKTQRLDAQGDQSGLFLNFQDTTSGKETYPAGRFLDTPGPKDGFVEIDFNRAVNPPCAFTSFATCPLPPPGNRLSIPVRAGEKTHHPG
jgi:uncharacterized protein (DUF1684 family)